MPPRKPDNHPRQVIRIGLPKAETTATWISNNQLLQHHPELAIEAANILSSVPPWLQDCAIHAKLDPVLGRCSWEENSSPPTVLYKLIFFWSTDVAPEA